MRRRAVVAVASVVVAASAVSACKSSRGAQRSQEAPARETLELRCEPRDEDVQCVALASDSLELSTDVRDVTPSVQWASDTSAVAVEGGRIPVNRGGTATMTATSPDTIGADSPRAR